MVKGKTLKCRTESQGLRLNESVAELSLPSPRMSLLLSSRALARGWTQEDLLALPAGRSMKHPHPGPGGESPRQPLPPMALQRRPRRSGSPQPHCQPACAKKGP